MWLSLVLSLLGIYNSISFFFLMNPTLLHEYKTKLQLPAPLHAGRWVLSHKGGGLERPEETVDAMEHSVTFFLINVLASNWDRYARYGCKIVI